MKTNECHTLECPKCKNTYLGHPALSRSDNTILICADCGVREALESIGVIPEEQEKILNIIHQTNIASKS